MPTFLDLRALRVANLKSIHVSDGNALYAENSSCSGQSGCPPTAEESLSAFADFAVASMRRFDGAGVVWELCASPWSLCPLDAL